MPFLGVVGSWLIKWRGRCWSELEVPVPGHIVSSASIYALSSLLVISPGQLCGVSSPLAPQGPVPSPLCCGKPGGSQQLILVAGIIACWAPCRQPLPPACLWPWPSLLSAPHSCPVRLCCLCPFLLEPSVPSWTLPSWPSLDSAIVPDVSSQALFLVTLWWTKDPTLATSPLEVEIQRVKAYPAWVFLDPNYQWIR